MNLFGKYDEDYYDEIGKYEDSDYGNDRNYSYRNHCDFCGQKGLHWEKRERWVLVGINKVLHKCLNRNKYE